MKKVIISLLLLTISNPVFAAKQTLEDSTTITSTSKNIGTATVNNFFKQNAMNTEVYTALEGKLNKSGGAMTGPLDIGVGSTTTGLINFFNSSAAYPVGLWTIGASAPGVGYRLTGTMPTENSVWVFDTSGYASWTPVSSLGGAGDDLGTASATDVSALFSGTGEYLKKDGTSGTPSGTVPSGTDGQILGYVGTTPTAITPTEITAGTGLSFDSATNTVNLDNTAVTPAQYTNPTVTIDAQGRITAATNGTGGSFAFDTFPTYEDSPHTGSGIAVNGTTLAVWSSDANKWLTAALSDSLNPTPIPPTVFGDITIDSTGLQVTVPFSENVQVGTGGGDDWSLNCSTTGTLAMGNPANLPSASAVFTLTGGPVLQGETCTASYTQPGNGIEAVDDGVDLVSISGTTTDNQSTETGVTSETIGNNIQGASTLSNNNSQIYLYPIAGTLSSNGSLASYTLTLNQQTGTREIKLALYTLSGSTFTIVPGSETGTILYTAAVDKTDVTIPAPTSGVSLNSGVQYYVAKKQIGYASCYGATTGGTHYIYNTTYTAGWPTSFTYGATGTELPGKLQITKE